MIKKTDDFEFAYSRRKNGDVVITRHGTVVTNLRADSAQKFLKKIEGQSPREQQLHMARFTGNYKRGNE